MPFSPGFMITKCERQGVALKPSTDGAIQWLLDGDPAIRWQTLRDLVGAPARTVDRSGARSRATVGALVCSPCRTPRVRGPAGFHPTAGSTLQSGRPRPTPCCCSATSVCRRTTARHGRRARSSSIAASSATVASTMDGAAGARRVSRGWCCPSCPTSGVDDARLDTIAQPPAESADVRRWLELPAPARRHSRVDAHDHQRARGLAPSRTAPRRLT